MKVFFLPVHILKENHGKYSGRNTLTPCYVFKMLLQSYIIEIFIDNK